MVRADQWWHTQAWNINRKHKLVKVESQVDGKRTTYVVSKLTHEVERAPCHPGVMSPACMRWIWLVEALHDWIHLRPIPCHRFIRHHSCVAFVVRCSVESTWDWTLTKTHSTLRTTYPPADAQWQHSIVGYFCLCFCSFMLKVPPGAQICSTRAQTLVFALSFFASWTVFLQSRINSSSLSPCWSICPWIFFHATSL